ncbi:MAG: alpha/beta fold hydrolase [Cyanobacteria bacterium REEB67]|nr:alpha/beta fold hydrolase [Cyanobacteria bacterium REEB67]
MLKLFSGFRTSFSQGIAAALLALCPLLPGITQGSPTEDQTAPVRKSDNDKITAKAILFIENLNQGKLDQLQSDFDPTMKAMLPATIIDRLWKTWQTQFGKFEQQLAPEKKTPTNTIDEVIIPCKFANSTQSLDFAFDKEGRISGLHLRPTEAAMAAAIPIPSYVNKSSFSDEDFTVGAGQWALPGTLSVPLQNGRMPAVVLVHGSGPQDRDETVCGIKAFRDIAWGLASRGIVVLRYEKRTKAHALQMPKEISTLTVKEETIDDALQAVQDLKQNKHVDPARIYILGHSLGGTVMPRIAPRAKDCAGFIIMAGATRPLEDLILEQYEYIMSLKPQPLSDEDKKTLAQIKGYVDIVKSPSLKAGATDSGLPPSWPATYWLDLRGYKPAEAAKDIDKPLLIMQGEKDYQVTSADLKNWQDNLGTRKNVTFKIYPKLGHMFTTSAGKPGPTDYEEPQNVDQAVVEDLSTWINSQNSGKPGQ